MHKTILKLIVYHYFTSHCHNIEEALLDIAFLSLSLSHLIYIYKQTKMILSFDRDLGYLPIFV